MIKLKKVDCELSQGTVLRNGKHGQGIKLSMLPIDKLLAEITHGICSE